MKAPATIDPAANSISNVLNQMQNEPQTQTQQYHQFAKLLHWLVAAMIVLQFVLAELAEMAAAESAQLAQLALLANHKSVGITILGLALLRLLWRHLYPPPPLPAAMPAWQITLSQISHWSLYVLLISLPISGWLMSSATAYSVSWFNLVTLPDLVPVSERLEAILKSIHEWLAVGLFSLALLHIAAAAKHALVDKDGVLTRMSSVAALGLFALTIAGGLAWLIPDNRPAQQDLSDTAQGAASEPTVTQSDTQAPAQATVSTLPVWDIDYDASHIRFSGDQAGAPFTGLWTRWQAKVQFDPAAMAASHVEVIVNTSQVDSNDSERDATITGSDFFAAAQYPQAIFRSQRFTRQEDQFTAQGVLQVKDITVPVDVQFTLQSTPAGGLLQGSASLDRLQLGIGTGDWTDTSWVGQFVTLDIKVVFSATAKD
ncbi:MAG: YceI family protein [Pseudomonadota bacterium]